jgi:hypothetical protein
MSTREELDAQYRNLAIICGAMVMGQLAFAGVAWFLNAGKTEPPSDPILTPMTYAWLAVSAATLPFALYLRQRLANLGSTATNLQDIRTGTLNFGIAQSQTIVMFALLEGSGLLGLVNYFLNPHPQLLTATLAVVIACAVIFFPRRSWFDAFQT